MTPDICLGEAHSLQELLFQDRMIEAWQPRKFTAAHVSTCREFVGQTILSYRMDCEVGRGGFSTVMRCTRLTDHQVYAAKITDLQKIRQEESEYLRNIKLRFARDEAGIMSKCQCENIVKCHDVLESEAFLILILEYCHGPTLERYVLEQGRLSQEMAVPILKQILNGLAVMHSTQVMHSQGIIHRDIKPENIFSNDEVFKLADLGLAKTLDNPLQEQFGSVLGSPVMIAPEMLAQSPYNIKVDIWSIGILYYFMLTGRYLYSLANASFFFKKVETGVFFEELTDLHISAESKDLLRQTLQVTISKRLDWKDLIRHRLFKKTQPRLRQSFILQPTLGEVSSPESLHPAKAGNNAGESLHQSQFGVPTAHLTSVDKPTESKHGEPAKQLTLSKQVQVQMLSMNQDQALPLNTARNRYPEADLSSDLTETKHPSKEAAKTSAITSSPFSKQKSNASPQSSTRHSGEDVRLWVKQSYWECLKAQKILREIFEPIHHWRLLDLTEKAHLEFLYLVLTRLRSPIAVINYRYELEKSNLYVASLQEQVKPLYQRINAFWTEISLKLTEVENRILSRCTEGWIRIRHGSEEKKLRSKFLSGIEGVDYNEQEQIDFTLTHYLEKIQKHLTQQISPKISEEVRRVILKVLQLLRSYKEIWFLDGAGSNFKNLDDKVEKMLIDSTIRRNCHSIM